jgi:hypothetical protein
VGMVNDESVSGGDSSIVKYRLWEVPPPLR